MSPSGFSMKRLRNRLKTDPHRRLGFLVWRASRRRCSPRAGGRAAVPPESRRQREELPPESPERCPDRRRSRWCRGQRTGVNCPVTKV